MTPDAFIAKWQANTRTERAAAQEHFLDLCALLDEPTPNSDPTGATYAFEKGALKASGGGGWADVWKRGRFAWEYKKKTLDLEAAHRQLLQYAGALENPPLLVTSDIARIIIRTNWTNAVSERHELLLRDLADPARLALLKHVFADPDRLRPSKTRAALTADAAATFANIAQRLRTRGHDPAAVAHFVNRLVFCLFADDVGLLPPGLFARMLTASRKNPERFERNAAGLFAAMAARNGAVDFTEVAWFNGGLFDDATALPLQADDIADLQRAASLDWADIDPSILGTLFERGLDPDKRSQLGAHYTSRDMIERLIDPVIRQPLLAEWANAKAAIEAALAAGARAKPASKAARDAKPRAQTILRAFLDRLRNFKILDPACGSGNFLYLSLLALKDIEHKAMVEAEGLGIQREFPQVGPEAVCGIEINPFAAELARVSVWIGHIQWNRKHGIAVPHDPILRPLDTIDCRDAILNADGSQAPWPTSDAIVGNPPFLGGKRLRNVLGDTYCDQLFEAYDGVVPAEADLVCYWFARAQAAIAAGNAARAGLVATNSIRGGANRRVLQPIAQAGAIFNAWSDEPWILDGAAVRVSLVCWSRQQATAPVLDGAAALAIHADLTAGAANVTMARRLSENAGIAFMGDTKGGAFDIPGPLARQWLAQPTNPNGRPNADVLRPWMNGMDVTRRPSDTWIVDFGWTMPETDIIFFSAPYAYINENVRPVRTKNNREAYARVWWRHVEPRPGMHEKLATLRRFIVTPRVAKHRVFTWLQTPTLPDTRLFAFARDDDFFFGILHSRFHEIWSLATASWHGVGNDPTYNATVCFETFPFPANLTPNLPAATYAANPHAQTIAKAAQTLVAARDHWLNPPDLVDRVPEIVPGYPDRLIPKNEAAAAILRRRTLTNLYNQRGTPEAAWLDTLHQKLDEAVAAAYGFPANPTDEDVLSRLLALNLARAAP